MHEENEKDNGDSNDQSLSVIDCSRFSSTPLLLIKLLISILSLESRLLHQVLRIRKQLLSMIRVAEFSFESMGLGEDLSYDDSETEITERGKFLLFNVPCSHCFHNNDIDLGIPSPKFSSLSFGFICKQA